MQDECAVQYVKGVDLVNGLRGLKRRGGAYATAADSVERLLGRIAASCEDPLDGLCATNNGEGRIKYCVKYDLTARCRLITVQHKKVCFLLFVGTHEEADSWLAKHRGREYRVDKYNRAVEVMGQVTEYDRNIWFTVSHSQGELYSHLPLEHWMNLNDGLQRLEMKELSSIRAGDYDQLHEACDDIADRGNRVQAEVVRSVFLSLMQDQTEVAINTIREYVGEIRDIGEEDSLVDSDKFIIVRRDDPDYAITLKRLVEANDYKQWMLFMHPEQEKIAVEKFDGSSKLVGVSGSGKTCTVVRRAIELAARYSGENILVLTLNPPLAKLIGDLVDTAAPPDLRPQIVVAPLFRLCQQILHREEPHNQHLYDEKTWKAHEHVDEIWREFYRCELGNHSAEVMQPVHDSLISRGIEAEKYIRQEFDWIRSAVLPGRRQDYLDLERRGRKYPLPKQFRERLLQGLAAWEEKMRFVGVTDYLGIATAASAYLSGIFPEYRCVIVDESQDFGTTELVLARKLCQEGTDDLMLCGDAAQQVSSKFQSMLSAGINVHPTRIRKLEKNYRNSKDILRAAHEVLTKNLSEDMISNIEFELLDPTYADFSGSAPVVLEGKSLADELGNALAYVDEYITANPGRHALIAICGYTMYEVEMFAESVGLPYLSPEHTVGDQTVVLSDLEQSKGFEFDLVCIVNCAEYELPDARLPEDEQFRDLARFYVAMTRAKSELIISWSNLPSGYIQGHDNLMLYGDWEDYVVPAEVEIPPLRRLAEIRATDLDVRKLEAMPAAEFLYQDEALGLALPVLDQLRKYVTGTGRTRGAKGERVEWSNIGDAHADIQTRASARRHFGPETSTVLMERFEGLWPRAD